MQALERTVIDTNWITILLLLLLVCIFLLKIINSKRLKGNLFSLVKNSFIETEIEEKNTVFNLFESLIFTFSMLVFSLLVYKTVLLYVDDVVLGINTYFKIVAFIFSYFLIKWLLEYLFSVLFLINNQVRFFLVSKSSYLFSISFLIFIGIIITEYTQLNLKFLIYFTLLLFLFRFVFHLVNNKKLIFSKLFYFILYLCAFEIAPLFILFKLSF